MTIQTAVLIETLVKLGAEARPFPALCAYTIPSGLSAAPAAAQQPAALRRSNPAEPACLQSTAAPHPLPPHSLAPVKCPLFL